MLQSQVTLLILFLSVANPGRILFFSGFSTYSHRLLVWPLVEELTSRGHHVTYLSSSRSREPATNVEDFVPSALSEFYKGEGVMNVNLLHSRLEGKLLEKWAEMPQLGVHLCKLILNSPDTKAWADKSHFDLIFVDALFNDCAFALVHKYKAKHILLGTTAIFTWNYDSLGIVPETSWIPDMVHHFPAAEEMSFWHRFYSTLENIRWHFVRAYYYLPKIEDIIRNDFGLQDFPQISELERNVSLYFTNTHFSEEFARAVPPFVVPVGGLHLQSNRTKVHISKDLENFISSRGSQGFIYVSFGTDTLISTLPQDQLETIFRALEDVVLPCIWRWDGEPPLKVPRNVLLAKWLPQQALLSHPNIKMMITHGGLLSIHEAVHHKVPLLVIPVFAEQDFNAERVHRKGFGIKLDIGTLKKDELKRSISGLIHDSRYKLRMEQISSIFGDRMNSPLDTALWYTEYVLRRDTSMMKPYSLYQTWYQRRLLDVWVSVFSLVVIGIIFSKIVLVHAFHILKNVFINLASWKGSKLKKSQ